MRGRDGQRATSRAVGGRRGGGPGNGPTVTASSDDVLTGGSAVLEPDGDRRLVGSMM